MWVYWVLAHPTHFRAHSQSQEWFGGCLLVIVLPDSENSRNHTCDESARLWFDPWSRCICEAINGCFSPFLSLFKDPRLGADAYIIPGCPCSRLNWAWQPIATLLVLIIFIKKCLLYLFSLKNKTIFYLIFNKNACYIFYWKYTSYFLYIVILFHYFYFLIVLYKNTLALV